jgi:para-aminobenzoate synthetase component 1
VLLQAYRWLIDSRDEATRRAARQSRRPVPALSLPHHHELHQDLPQGPEPGQGDRRDQEDDGGAAVRHGALVALGGPIILSRSPELFFEVSADGWIESLPMKGTARRGKTDAEDERLKQELANDPKNQAENRMIVDLLRNDISRISEVGTLSVPQLFHIESYATLHQMVSRVRAKLLRRTGISQIFAALFPCGSITGAPKIRAMEILNELEGAPRGAYCGSIGWIAPNGEMRFNVAIRTLTLFDGGEAIYNVGGGVVFDSTAESEYRECLLKARFVTGQEPATN